MSSGSIDGETPLDRYLSGLKAESPFETTRFLAEDRVLGFEVMAASRGDFHLHYAVDCAAISDDCVTLAELLQQRRRWINSGLTCALWMQLGLGRYLRTSTSSWRRKLRVIIGGSAVLTLQNLALWFAPAASADLLLLCWRSVSGAVSLPGPTADLLFAVVAIVWVVPVLSVLTGAHRTFSKRVAEMVLGAASIATGVLLGAISLSFGLVGALCIMLLPLLLLLNASLVGRGFFWRHALTIVRFGLMIMPMNLMLITHALLHSNNMTWGTKGLTRIQSGSLGKKSAKARQRRFDRFRAVLLVAWLASNSVVITATICASCPLSALPLILFLAAILLMSLISTFYFLDRSKRDAAMRRPDCASAGHKQEERVSSPVG